VDGKFTNTQSPDNLNFHSLVVAAGDFTINSFPDKTLHFCTFLVVFLPCNETGRFSRFPC